MDSLLISAASGMKARMDSLDMLANNLANTSTAGFKADREFNGLYAEQLPVVENRWTDYSQGVLLPTGNSLDLAISGDGFFALNGVGGVVYSRNGSFQVSKNNQLATVEGYTLRNSLDTGKAITVDPAQDIQVSKNGTVSQGGRELGQLEIGQMPTSQGGVGKLGNSYFALTGRGPAATPAVTTGQIVQGHLEQSNVPAADSAVRLVNLMRQFEMLQRALNIGTQMNKEAIQEVAKVS